jgi:CheY-like chemotaxis protein
MNEQPLFPAKVVLVIDDDPGVQELLGAVLANDGYQVEVADDGVDAVQKYLSLRPSLIILDYMMPKMDGKAFLEELRQRGESRTPIIMISAKMDISDEQKALVQAFIAKPFSIVHLLNEVARWQVSQRQDDDKRGSAS